MTLINYVTRIHFAEHVLEDALDAEFAALAITRPLVVSDHDDERGAAALRMELAMPRRATASVFAAPSGLSTEADCETAALLYRDNDCDGLIGFGGASAIDLAKAVAVRLSHTGTLRQYAGGQGGGARIRNVLPPVLAVPTTAGSGSEAGPSAMLATADGPNMVLASPFLVPRVVICDPTLTLELGWRQTACSAMDALTHCLETFMASAYNPPADGIALDGLRRAAANIERVVEDGSDVEARREMMAAALNGALAQQKGLGGVHAMSHALSAVLGGRLDHGAANAILLPHVIEFNAPAVAPRYDRLRHEFALPGGGGLGTAIERLRERLGLPARLSELGLGAGVLARAASYAACDHSNRTNPRKARAQDYLEMLRAAH